MIRKSKRGGLAITGNTHADQNLAQLEKAKQLLGGSKKRKKPKKKSYKK